MPGSGLGLSIVRQVAERHGGSVVAGRAEGGGAEFRMHLPGRGEPHNPTPGAHSTVTAASQRTLSGG
jgi:two-component system sensor histidine kinase MprB